MKFQTVHRFFALLFVMSIGISVAGAWDIVTPSGLDDLTPDTYEEMYVGFKKELVSTFVLDPTRMQLLTEEGDSSGDTDKSRENEKEFSRIVAAGLNIIPAFGTGSFLQGNKKAGFIQAGIQGGALLTAIALFALGAQEGGTLGGAGHALAGSAILAGGILVGDIYGVISVLSYEP